MYTLTELNQLLTDNKFVEFTFTKKDGTTRVLKGTKDFDEIPKEHHPVNQVVESEEDGKVTDFKEPTTLKVFDVAAVGWRSIKPETVTLVKIKI